MEEKSTSPTIRRLSLSLLFLMAILTATAEQTLAVHLFDGNVMHVSLDGSPKITLIGTGVNIAIAEEEISYDICDIHYFSIEEYSLDAIEKTGNNRQGVFHVLSQGVRGEHLLPNSSVYVYDISGRLIEQGLADECGEAFITLQRGQYIIRNQNTTLKINKR